MKEIKIKKFETVTEYVDGIIEASSWGTGHYLRKLFAMLLMSNSISRPEFVWEKTWKELADDILYKQQNILQMHDLQLSDEQLQHYTLSEIEKILQNNGCSLRNYCPTICHDDFFISDRMNKLIAEETQYDKESLRVEHEHLIQCLTDEQRAIYDEIMHTISEDNGGVYFLYGYGGTGKTFMWRTLCAALRSKGEIVLPVASSGIASLLLPNGRTTHSRFGISLTITSGSMCRGIELGSDLAALLKKTRLIIWDEAPIVHRHCFEALDRSMRDAIRGPNGQPSNMPFGGKVIVFGGDLRQTLSVILKGTCQDIISVTLNSSPLWDSCKFLKLTKNMWLRSGVADVDEIKEFAECILMVGDGRLGEPNDGEAVIEILDDLLIKATNDPIGATVHSTYPNLHENFMVSSYFEDKAILAPTNDVVSTVNEYVLSMLDGDDKVYYSSDNVSKCDGCMGNQNSDISVELLNTIKCSGLPNHLLRLKVGAPVMLLRNIDQPAGLCNST